MQPNFDEMLGLEEALPGYASRRADKLLRFRKHCTRFKRDYSLRGPNLNVDWYDATHANARVGRDASGYSIGLTGTFPYFLDALFLILLFDEEVLYWLPLQSKPPEPGRSIPFAVAPSQLSGISRYPRPQTAERTNAAYLLADIAAEFVFFHEVGHILGGHCDYLFETSGQSQISELALVKRASGVPLKVSQSWEFEADIIACRLLLGYLNALITVSQKINDDHRLRPVLGSPSIAVEQVISLAVIALYGLFRYLGETRTKLDAGSAHPDPLVRAFACRNAIVPAMKSSHKVRGDLLDEMLIQRFEEFDDGLEALSIHSSMTENDIGIESVNDALSAVAANWRAHRDVVAKHRYISWG